MYFLYKLIDPITKEVKYIGYTKRPKTRLWEHIRDAKVGIKTYKCDWIRSLINEAVKFTGVSSKQIKKLIELNKKSRKGFLFQKLIHEPFI
jgi:predicted GIY-YIG superfamily endonuclease